MRIRFAFNHPLLFILSVEIAFVAIITLSVILTLNFLQYLALSETMIAMVTSVVPIPFTVFIVSLIRLSATIPEKLVQKHLDQAVDINQLAGTFLKLTPEFVTALNQWARNESQEIGSRWEEARKQIMDFSGSTLSTLSLQHYNLHSLPNVFDDPKFRNNLNELFVDDNHLTRLPESIGSLQSLTHLNLANNRELAGLPSAILQLPPTCTVNIANCNFSVPVLETIRQITNERDYVGPRISHSRHNLFNRSQTIPSIEQSLRNFYRISGRNYNGLPEVNSLPNLRLWLYKITWVADFKGKAQRAFVSTIIKYLERANEDEAFRTVFAATISDATDSCGDRVALSVLNLGVTHKLSTIDLNNMRELHYLLTRGVFALDLLQNIARRKIPTMRMFDEIQVYLGYPVQLKQALNLPIDIDDMLYFEWSALSSQDLETAKNEVLGALRNEDMQVAFLKNQPKWIEALKMNYPEEMERIAEDPNRPEEGFINLIKDIIQSFNS